MTNSQNRSSLTYGYIEALRDLFEDAMVRGQSPSEILKVYASYNYESFIYDAIKEMFSIYYPQYLQKFQVMILLK
jgi:hypothetical protein